MLGFPLSRVRSDAVLPASHPAVSRLRDAVSRQRVHAPWHWGVPFAGRLITSSFRQPPVKLGRHAAFFTLAAQRTAICCLDRWAWSRAVGAEYAAVARFWAEERAAARAFIEILAGIGWHRLKSGGAAHRAGDGGFRDHIGLRHRRNRDREAPNQQADRSALRNAQPGERRKFRAHKRQPPLPRKQDSGCHEANGCGSEQKHHVRRRDESKATEPRRAQSDRGEQKGQPAARCNAKGSNEPSGGRRHGAGAMRQPVAWGIQRVRHNALLAAVWSDPTVCSNYRRKPFPGGG
jgi:hypothetical protein